MKNLSPILSIRIPGTRDSFHGKKILRAFAYCSEQSYGVRSLFCCLGSDLLLRTKLRSPLFILLFGIGPFAFCLLPAATFSQAPPPGINYQAIARDISGNPLATATVTVTFNIHKTSSIGPIVYTETHNTSTNQFGLFTLVIGSANPSAFDTLVIWRNGPHFLEVIVNGNNMGTNQFMSVPYSFHSKTATFSGFSVYADTAIISAYADTALVSLNGMPPGIAGQTLRHNGINWVANSNLYNDGTNVGIGTTAPGAKLHVYNPLGTVRTFIEANDLGAYLDFRGKTGWNIASIYQSNTDNNLRFQTNFSDRLVLNGSGTQTLIQFSTPSTSNTIENRWVGFSNPALSLFSSYYDNLTQQAIMGYFQPHFVINNKTASGQLQFSTNNTQRMVVDANGNVGIGTTAPTAKLEILKTTAGDALFSTNTYTIGAAGNFEINNTASTSSALVGRTNGSGNAIVGINTGVWDAIFGNSTGTQGKAGNFQINNISNFSDALYSSTNGTGNAITAIATGTGKAGFFQISNATSTADALFVSTNGAGNAAWLNGKIKITDGTQGANKVLTSDAAGVASWQMPAASAPGFSNIQVYSTAGTFTFTTGPGVTRVMVEVWGGGGGGAGSGSMSGSSAGGGGGYGKDIFTVTPSANYTVTVGAGGFGGCVSCLGNAGGTSSFGNLISAAGGNGGVSANQNAGGTSLATFNISGGAGINATTGYSSGGNGGNGGTGGINPGLGNGIPGLAPGGGGSGGVSGFGGNGASGRVVVWW